MRSGKLKALGVGSAKRSALLPDVPTIAETEKWARVIREGGIKLE